MPPSFLFILVSLLVGTIVASLSNPLITLSPPRAAPPSLLSNDPLTPIVTIHSIDSDIIRVTGIIDRIAFYDELQVDLFLEFDGADVLNADFTRTTSELDSPVYTGVSYADAVEVRKNLIKAVGFEWPKKDGLVERSFELMLKVKHVNPTGFQIKSGSYLSAYYGDIIQKFTTTTGPAVGSMGKLVTAFKEKPRKSVFDPLYADIDFTLHDLKIPSNVASALGFSLVDLLHKVKFTGPEKVICSVGKDKEVEVFVEANRLTIPNLAPFAGVSTVRVLCPNTVQADFAKTASLPHLWTLSYTDAQAHTYIAQHSQVRFLQSDDSAINTLTASIIIVGVLIVLVFCVVVGSSVAKIGPFKPKNDHYDDLESGLVNDRDGSYPAY